MDDKLPYISSITTQKQLNACKLFLNITFLSEVTDIDDNHLLQGFLQENNSKIPPITLY